MADPANTNAPRVVISGWYGHENVGDEAMLSVLLEAFERRDAATRFTVLSERPDRARVVHDRGERLDALDHPIPYGPLRMLDSDLRRATARIREAVRGASLVVLGGGSLLRDRGRANYLRLVDELSWAQRAGVPTAVVGVSVGPLTRRWGRALARRLLSGADLVSVRDAESLRVLRDLGVDPAKASHDGDLTLALDVGPVPPPADDAPVLVAPCRAMLTGLRDGAKGNPDLEADLARALDGIADRSGAPIEFVPFRCAPPEEDDVALCERIRGRMQAQDRATVAPHDLDARVVKRRFAEAGFVVAARLHALHFALAGRAPTVAIAYGQKVERLFFDLGLNDYALAPRSASRSKLLERYERSRDEGARDFARARERLKEHAARVRAMLERLAALA